jgi:hypothetical protein
MLFNHEPVNRSLLAEPNPQMRVARSGINWRFFLISSAPRGARRECSRVLGECHTDNSPCSCCIAAK